MPRTAGGDDDATVLDAVLSGRADLGVTSTVLAPLGIDSLAMEERVLRSDLAREITAPAGLVTFGLLPGPLIRPAGVMRPLLGASSYRDLRVAMRPAANASGILTELGAKLVPNNFRGAELFTVDAIAAPAADIAARVYDGAVTTMTTNVALGAAPLVIFGRSTEFGDALTAAARAAIPAAVEFRRAEENVAVGAMCRRGRVDFVTAGDADVATLRNVLPQDTRIDALRADAPPPPDVPSCAGVTDGTMSTLLDGVYEIESVSGNHRITLAHGRYEGTGSHGTYAVRGDALIMNDATDTDTMVFRWNLYRDRLTLYPVEDRNSPVALRASPWHRVGGPPVAEPTVVDGVYELTTDDGVFRWTLHGGQVRQDHAGAWARGSFVLDGDSLAVTYAELGGEKPAAGPIRLGETAFYRWNLYRGRLYLSSIEGANSPAIFTAAWRRVGDVP
ncbi:MAG TPA: hypothetical protein VNP92_19675 [Actinophytocola sp.]|nr:hypothetical protein [Actinophytocola sp.]